MAFYSSLAIWELEEETSLSFLFQYLWMFQQPTLHLKKNHISLSFLDPQHHRQQLCGLGARRSPPTGHVGRRRRLQDSEPDEETAESSHSALLHERGGYHHLRGGSFCGSHRLRLHLDRAVAGGWRRRPRSLCLPYRYRQSPGPICSNTSSHPACHHISFTGTMGLTEMYKTLQISQTSLC